MKASEFLIKTIHQTVPLLKIETIPMGFATTVDMMFETGNLHLDRERFNILISYWHLPPAGNCFFNHYFPNQTKSLEEFKKGLDCFIIDALWHFGDLEKAYLKLCDLKEIDAFFNEHRFSDEELQNRLPWNLIEEIKPEDRGFLGYVSGQRPKLQKDSLTFAELVISEIEENKSVYSHLDKDKITPIVLEKIAETVPDIKKEITNFSKLSGIKETDLFTCSELDKIKAVLNTYKQEIDETINKVNLLKEIGKRNQEHYLRNIESIDVYVATSMRNDEEYLDMHNFVVKTFNDDAIKKLNLRYFDPTLCYCDSRIDKGIIECLLVRSSKVTIYCAQEGDTFGKDSELAATMAQGKPVIVYVPTPKEPDANTNKDNYESIQLFNEKKQKMDTRAKTFKDFHPLGLQVGLYDGVARGVIVVRTPEECAEVLFKILSNKLEVNIVYEQHGLVLREKTTNSVLRVMTGWGVLSSCFWNQFNNTKSPKSGLTD